MRIKHLVSILFVLWIALPAFSQSNYLVTGSISASSTDCSVANSCVVFPKFVNDGAMILTVSGTFSATLQVEGSLNKGQTGEAWSAITTAKTGTGYWIVQANGLTGVRLRASSYTSGTASIVMDSAITASPTDTLSSRGSSTSSGLIALVAGGTSQTTYSTGTSSPASDTISYTAPSGTDTLLVITTSTYSSSNFFITGITFNGVSLSKQMGTLAPASNTQESAIWYMLNPPVTTANVIVSYSGSAGVLGRLISINTYSGVHQTQPFHATNGISSQAASGSTITSRSVIAPNGGMVLDVATTGGGVPTASAGTGQTVLVNGSATSIWGGASYQPSTGAAVTPSWSLSASQTIWSEAVVGLNPDTYQP